jgi:holo-[acyl-carrier protein] synthase
VILGTGVDAVNIDRIERLFLKYGSKFLNRILSSKEIEICDKYQNIDLKIRYLSKRFAAKEAVSKALGTGIGEVSFKDIEILNDGRGSPFVNLCKKINLSGYNKYNIHISISDDRPVAIAFAIISI